MLVGIDPVAVDFTPPPTHLGVTVPSTILAEATSARSQTNPQAGIFQFADLTRHRRTASTTGLTPACSPSPGDIPPGASSTRIRLPRRRAGPNVGEFCTRTPDHLGCDDPRDLQPLADRHAVARSKPDRIAPEPRAPHIRAGPSSPASPPLRDVRARCKQIVISSSPGQRLTAKTGDSTKRARRASSDAPGERRSPRRRRGR